MRAYHHGRPSGTWKAMALCMCTTVCPCVGVNVEDQHLLSSSAALHIIFGDGSTH